MNLRMCIYVCVCVHVCCCMCKGPEGLLATDVKVIPVLFLSSQLIACSLHFSSLHPCLHLIPPLTNFSYHFTIILFLSCISTCISHFSPLIFPFPPPTLLLMYVLSSPLFPIFSFLLPSLFHHSPYGLLFPPYLFFFSFFSALLFLSKA